MATPVAAVFGGSGFIGRYIVERLAQRGWIMRIAVRRPDEALFLKPLGDIAQIVPIGANIRHERSVANAVQGVDTVINLVGILHQSGAPAFRCRACRWRAPPGARGDRCRRAPLPASLGPRRRSAIALGLRTLQGRGRSDAARAFPVGDRAPSQRRLRTGGRFLQPLCRHGTFLAGAAPDRRRHDALPAGLCGRCRRRRGRGAGKPGAGRPGSSNWAARRPTPSRSCWR